MLNAQPIGGKKGSRWRDDVWTMKYLPKFKWNMLTEQIGESLLSLRIISNILSSKQRTKPLYIQRSSASSFLNPGRNSGSISRMSSLRACWTNGQNVNERALVMATDKMAIILLRDRRRFSAKSRRRGLRRHHRRRSGNDPSLLSPDRMRRRS